MVLHSVSAIQRLGLNLGRVLFLVSERPLGVTRGPEPAGYWAQTRPEHPDCCCREENAPGFGALGAGLSSERNRYRDTCSMLQGGRGSSLVAYFPLDSSQREEASSNITPSARHGAFGVAQSDLKHSQYHRFRVSEKCRQKEFKASFVISDQQELRAGKVAESTQLFASSPCLDHSPISVPLQGDILILCALPSLHH